jgi:prolyl-tRNA synthetase
MPYYMGCYGIGVGRTMATAVEIHHDEKGIIWPESIAPFKIHLVGLNLEDGEIKDWADGVYQNLVDGGVEVLYDDRIETRAGEKFGDSDLLGMPYRVVVSKKGRKNGQFEVVTRASGEVRQLTEEELFADFS